jgi:hypothetical protein
MTTNILALPLTNMSMLTGNNEDMVESVLFQVGGTGSPSLGVAAEQLDLRGIDFNMYVRRSASDHEVVMTASTDDHTLSVGAFPNYGFLLFAIPVDVMLLRAPATYVADVVATADGFTRRCIVIDLSIVEGITR